MEDTMEDETPRMEESLEFDDRPEGDDIEDGIYNDDDLMSLMTASFDEVDTTQKNFTQKERVEMIHMRGYLDRMNAKVEAKQQLVNKHREELRICRQRLCELDEEEMNAQRHLAVESETGNMASVYRLRAQLTRIVQERVGERDLQAHILATLEPLEYDLTLAQIEQGKYLLAEANLKDKEADYAQYQRGVAGLRQHGEKKFAQLTENLYQRRDEQIEKVHELEDIYSKLNKVKIKEAHERHNRYLKNTMDHIRQMKEREENRGREDLERKIKSVLTLKQDLTKTRENLTSLQARDNAMKQKAAGSEEALRQSVLLEGGNADAVLLRHRKEMSYLQKEEEFKKQQRQHKLEIAAKLLTEDHVMVKKKKQLPYLFETPDSEKLKRVKPLPKKKLQILKSIEREVDASRELAKDLLPPGFDESRFSEADASSDEGGQEVSADKFVEKVMQEDESMQDTLAHPEFEGLWEKRTTDALGKERTEESISVHQMSKMEEEIRQRVLEQTRANIITRQIAAGREFKGQAFNSKPEIIHFKDFDVGKVYKKKIALTNVSYTVNYCKLVGLTERLKDFIELKFDPPGQLSAGMTCDLHVTFSPKINEDLEGEVSFMAQTGPFVIPLRCTTKKCDLSVDQSLIDFGTSVIGETLKRYVTLRNNGAKGTKFEFIKFDKLKESECESETDITTQRSATEVLGAPDSQQQANGATEVVNKVPDPAPAAEEEDDPLSPDKPREATVMIDPRAPPSGDILDCMSVGHVTGGEVGPFSELQLEIVWKPQVTDVTESFFVIVFDDEASEKIIVTSRGRSIDVPVWVERNTVDLRICMYDRLYQDTLLVNNRASTALRLKFEVPPPLKNHLECLPKTGYIQAHSQFSAQIKFIPRPTLATDAAQFFDPITGVLEVPMVIRVADQTRPVEFTVQGVVTASDLEFNLDQIDFGFATIHESVIKTIKMTNKSILPQKYGFVGLPDYVEVQPNDGFGVLLPQETIDLDIVFSPPKAREYKFEIHCKSLINRSFKVACCGVGVHPPMELSEQVIHFPATALMDTSKSSIYVVNAHTSTNQYTHPVPRIGQGEIVPVGPTSFEFVVPKNAPVTVSPLVGTVEPGKRIRIHVSYSPQLLDSAIREEACRLLRVRLENEARLEYEQAVEAQKKAEEEAEKPKSGKSTAKTPVDKKGAPAAKKGKGSPKRGATEPVDLSSGPRKVEVQSPESLDKSGDDYAAGLASLMRQYGGGFETVRIPCYVATGPCPLEPGQLPYSVHNTVYLEVHCPSVRPRLVVISNRGRTHTDFGMVSVGQKVKRSITVQNISTETLELRSSLLDPHGPFLLVNALRPLHPNGTHTLHVSFTPTGEDISHEILSLETGSAHLQLPLSGRGVLPKLTVRGPQEDIFDLGAVLNGEYVERPMTLENVSALSVDFRLCLDSESPLRRQESEVEVPRFLQSGPTGKRPAQVGVQNAGGQAVFDCVPVQGTIKAGQSLDVTVTFAPDHPSDFFSDTLRVELFEQEVSHVFSLTGTCKPHVMYVSGGDAIGPQVESLGVTMQLEEEAEAKLVSKTYLLTFGAVMRDDGKILPAHRVLHVGCVRTMAVSQKKNGEFNFENVNTITPLGFTIDPIKAQVESGAKKPVQITWTPPSGHDPNKPLEASIIVTTKGDVSEQFRVILRALVVASEGTIPNEKVKGD